MLQQKKPDDYMIVTDTTTTVREIYRIAFGHLSLNYEDYIRIDPAFYRPAEVDVLQVMPAKPENTWLGTKNIAGNTYHHDGC